MFKMDLSKFKKVSGDKHHTVLRHDNGHEFKVVHAALPAKMRLKLKAIKSHEQPSETVKMSNGGNGQDEMSRANRGEEIYEKDQYGNIIGKKKPAKQKYEESHEKAFKEWFPMSEGGKAKKPEPSPSPSAPAVDPDKFKAFQQGFNKALVDGGKPENAPVVINIGKPEDMAKIDPSQIVAQPQQPMPQQMSQEASAAPSQMGIPQPQMPQPQSSAQQGDLIPYEKLIPQNAATQQQGMAEQSAPQAGAPAQQDPFGYGQMAQDIQEGVQLQEQGLAGQAKVESELGRVQANLAQKKAQAFDKLQQFYKDNYEQNNKEVSDVIDDMRTGKINANQYMEEMGAGQKVMTAIGLLLGGIGQGFIGGDNPALTFLNAQIDRNLKAQQANMDKKATLLGAYFKKFGNMQDAAQMFRIVNQEYYTSLAEEQAARLKDPAAKAKFLQMKGQIKEQKAGQLADISRRQAILQGGEEGHVAPEALINVLVPEKDQKAAREELADVKAIDHASQQVSNIIDKIGKLGPLQALPFSEGSAMLDSGNAQIIQVVRSGMKGQGALSDQEVEDVIKPFVINASDTPAQVAQKRAGILNIVNGVRARATPTLGAYPKILNSIKKPSGIKEGPSKL